MFRLLRIPSESAPLLLLRWSAFTLLFSRAWLYLFQDAPIRSLLWSETLAGPWVKRLLGLDWPAYASTSDPYIRLVVRAAGALLLAAACTIPFLNLSHRRCVDLVLAATAVLCLHGVACFADKWHVAMLVEMSLHALTPLLLLLALRYGEGARAWRWPALVLLALTFSGHGWYASGWRDVPVEFMNMTVRILGVDEATAVRMLKGAAHLDFLAATLIFVPWLRVREGALGYMCLWGFATALARVVSHYTPAESYHGLNPWLFETLVRLHYGLVPLALLLAHRRRRAAHAASASDLRESARMDVVGV